MIGDDEVLGPKDLRVLQGMTTRDAKTATPDNVKEALAAAGFPASDKTEGIDGYDVRLYGDGPDVILMHRRARRPADVRGSMLGDMQAIRKYAEALRAAGYQPHPVSSPATLLVAGARYRWRGVDMDGEPLYGSMVTTNEDLRERVEWCFDWDWPQLEVYPSDGPVPPPADGTETEPLVAFIGQDPEDATLTTWWVEVNFVF